MAYEVLARKWRPQKFEDVVGQDHVTQTLGNAIKSSRTAHAYLFVGPRGIGKTSVARIFAKALNCEKGPAEEPCCKCDTCGEIAGGSSMDVIEIDGASNNSVEQIRDLRETVKYAPTGTFKIYIIDEVHMLSTSAFNALLKTLEEPPPFVKFMFATTEPQKILPTIISRCQRFDLRRIPVNLIIDRLKLIAKAEKVKIEEDALLAIARGAEGGLRDAESALDQLISFRGNEIKESDVLSVFGLVSRSKLEEIALNILDGDIKALIGLVAELDESGKDMQRVLMELIGHFRNVLVYLNVGDDITGLDFTEAQLGVLAEHAAKANTGRVLRVCSILAQADDKIKYALSRRTILEMALIRSARASVVVTLEEVLSKVSELRGSAVGVETPVKKKPEKVEPEEDLPAPAVSEDDELEEPEDEPAVVDEVKAVSAVESDSELSLLQGRWKEIIEKVGKRAPLAKSVLVDAAPVSVNSNVVVVGFDPEFADEIDNFKAGRNRKALEMVLRSVLGRDVKVDIVSGGGPEVKSRVDAKDQPAAPSQGNSEVGGQQEEAPEPEEKRPAVAGPGEKTTQDWIKDPAVKQALEMFDGTILDVRE